MTKEDPDFNPSLFLRVIKFNTHELITYVNYTDKSGTGRKSNITNGDITVT